MLLNLSGNNINISDSIHTRVADKVSQLKEKHPTLNFIDVVVSDDKYGLKIDMETMFKGTPLSVKIAHNCLNFGLSRAVARIDAALSYRNSLAD